MGCTRCRGDLEEASQGEFRGWFTVRTRTESTWISSSDEEPGGEEGRRLGCRAFRLFAGASGPEDDPAAPPGVVG